LLFAADASVAQLALGLPDLRSRLQLCVQFEIHELDDAGKAQALKENAQQRGLELKDDVAQYILQRSERNLHDLIAVLDCLDTLSLAEQRRITIPFVKAAMQW